MHEVDTATQLSIMIEKPQVCKNINIDDSMGKQGRTSGWLTGISEAGWEVDRKVV